VTSCRPGKITDIRTLHQIKYSLLEMASGVHVSRWKTESVLRALQLRIKRAWRRYKMNP